MVAKVYMPWRGVWIPLLLLTFLGVLAVLVVTAQAKTSADQRTGLSPMDMAPMDMPHTDMSHMDMPIPGSDADVFEREMYRDMAKMFRDMHAPGYTGDRDVDFLAMMIPHHQGAIDMARLVLIHGRDPRTRNIAADIIASQQAEIEAMKGRLAGLRRTAADGTGAAYPALSGTRGGAAEIE